LIGLVGTNPESWRLKQLLPVLSARKLPHQALYPWLLTTRISPCCVQHEYDGNPISGPDAALFFDLLYLISLGLEELPESLYKLGLFREIGSHGTRMVNSLETVETCRNKADQTLRMAEKGVKVPPTLITESVHLAVDFILRNRPCVLKPVTGLQGRGIILIPESMREGDVVDYVSWFQGRYGKDVIYVQRFIEHPGYDIRALVIGGQVASKMRRFNPDSWRTNIAAGARPLPSDDEIDDLAIKAAASVGGEVVGVDILPKGKDDYYVLEVNAFPGWKGLQEVTRSNIAEMVVDYLCSLL